MVTAPIWCVNGHVIHRLTNRSLEARLWEDHKDTFRPRNLIKVVCFRMDDCDDADDDDDDDNNDDDGDDDDNDDDDDDDDSYDDDDDDDDDYDDDDDDDDDDDGDDDNDDDDDDDDDNDDDDDGDDDNDDDDDDDDDDDNDKTSLKSSRNSHEGRITVTCIDEVSKGVDKVTTGWKRPVRAVEKNSNHPDSLFLRVTFGCIKPTL